MVRTLVTTFTDRPELAAFQHLLFLYRDLLLLHHLHVHHIICQKTTECKGILKEQVKKHNPLLHHVVNVYYP